MLEAILWACAGGVSAALALTHVVRLHRRIAETEEKAQTERLKTLLLKNPAARSGSLDPVRR